MLKLEHKEDGWWIKSDRPDVLDMGPYSSKVEATEDMRGVERTLQSPEPKKR